jgi:uncharacterized membrane protein
MVAAYLATLTWQPVWHWLLPHPLGAGNAWLALALGLPLLIPLAGLLRGTYRSMIWAGLLLMLYFTIGVMEAWSNGPQRLPAMVQVVLPVLYLYAFRRRNQQRA